MFIDRTTLEMIAGKGGDGLVSWRREKYIPKGGPYGGNGGDGGSVILRADPNVYDLESFRHVRRVKAENGQQGGTACCHGRCGENLLLLVPMGTLVKDIKTDELLCDLTEEGQEFVVCQGGFGGRGNYSFKSSTNRAPTQFTKGTFGEERQVELELKLIADVGLVGFPNAGKSTLIENLTDVRVKKAPYPFTTLHPNLGYVKFEDESKILLADIPGIIEGAHMNKGLGLEFLRHIERTKVLIYVVDGSGIDGRHPLEDLEVLKNELRLHNNSLCLKPSLVVYNKADTEEAEELFWDEFVKGTDVLHEMPVFKVSALRSEGFAPLLDALKALCH